ncbi:spore protein [Bacillus sp. FSL H8-0515]|nr:spore protein [Bacillus sp. S20C3]MCY8204792.1 spore protein [Bacillus sp. N12A5]MCY8288806.1 spore protein [Bacillus sp. N13C7]MCY8638289.1 spore protein [Bacillus sp. S17B2]MCY8719415.1 spore protein [Bacillus sp. S10C12M]MCY9142185.1 spore protein [Bacillus sp. T9C1]
MSENRHENEENTDRNPAVAKVQNSGNAKVVVNVNTDQDQAQAQSQDGEE